MMVCRTENGKARNWSGTIFSKLIIELKVETCVGELKGAALYLLSREALLAPTLADEELGIKANFPKTAKR